VNANANDIAEMPRLRLMLMLMLRPSFIGIIMIMIMIPMQRIGQRREGDF
jgi:hypothetical protein